MGLLSPILVAHAPNVTNADMRDVGDWSDDEDAAEVAGFDKCQRIKPVGGGSGASVTITVAPNQQPPMPGRLIVTAIATRAISSSNFSPQPSSPHNHS